jgi:maltooligosyltrehalose synthase
VAQTLLGGIGPQVSNIARQIDNSLQVTANAEYRIQNRSVFARIFMGGDSANANAIKQEVEQNQARIEQLTQLINQANISSDVKVTLQEQIQNMTTEQTRLQNLANQQLGQWGIFSWRFF